MDPAPSLQGNVLSVEVQPHHAVRCGQVSGTNIILSCSNEQCSEQRESVQVLGEGGGSHLHGAEARVGEAGRAGGADEECRDGMFVLCHD